MVAIDISSDIQGSEQYRMLVLLGREFTALRMASDEARKRGDIQEADRLAQETTEKMKIFAALNERYIQGEELTTH